VDVEWRRAAAYVVCRDETGRVLLTRFVSPAHPDSGKWTMPGGGMKWGESPEQTEFDAGTTDDARWFAVDDVRRLPRVELVDFVLDLIA
jgi:hypothetical protein